MAEVVSPEWAAQFVCPRHGRATPAMVTTKKTCLFCDAMLIRQGPPGKLTPDHVPEPERQETYSWLIREVEADEDRYDLEQGGRVVLVEQSLAEVEHWLDDYGSVRDEIIFQAKDGYQTDHHFRDPPGWER